MDIRIASGGGEQLENFGIADSVTVMNSFNEKPFISSSPPPSTFSISSTSASVLAVSSSESVIDSLKAIYGHTSRSNGEEKEEEFDWVAVEREVDVIFTDKAPEIGEVEEAFSSLQMMFNNDGDNDRSEDQISESEFVLDWIEPPLQLCNTRFLQPYMLDRFYDAFHLFQTDPSVQRMVMSLASDRAVWDAVMNNEVVRELITNAERSEENSGSAASFIKKLFGRSSIKIMDAMERVTKYITDLFCVVVPGDEGAVLATGAAPVMEKLQMTVLLTVLVLLIVLATRAR